MKGFVGSKVSAALEDKLHTKVSIGRVDLGMFNRIIIDNVNIADQAGQPLLSAPRLSVKINIIDLLEGKISISSAQIFGLKANLYKKTATDKPNFQFILDAFASKDTTKHTPLNVEISSLIIRRSEVNYNLLDAPQRTSIDPNHIGVKEISAHIILNTLTDDSLNLSVKKISCTEKHGLTLKKLALKLAAGQHGAMLSDFELSLPKSSIHWARATVGYDLKNKKIIPGSLKYNSGDLKVALSGDESAVLGMPKLCFHEPITALLNFEGTDTDVFVNNFQLENSRNLLARITAQAHRAEGKWQWQTTLHQLSFNEAFIANIDESFGTSISKLNLTGDLTNVSLTAKAHGTDTDGTVDGELTTGVGKVLLAASRMGDTVNANVLTTNLHVGALLGNEELGDFSGSVEAKATLNNGKIAVAEGRAEIGEMEFRNHIYNDAVVTANYSPGANLLATLSLNDDAAKINAELRRALSGKQHTSLVASVAQLCPDALGLSKKWPDATFDFNIEGDIEGTDIQDIVGNIHLGNLLMQSPKGDYALRSLDINKTKNNGSERLTLKSDFANILVEGTFSYATLAESITSALAHRLPTMPGIRKSAHINNKVSVYATITRSDWAERLLDLPLQINEPMHLIADIDDHQHRVNMNVDAARFSYNGDHYKDAYLIVSSPSDTLKAKLNLVSTSAKGDESSYLLSAQAVDNHIKTQLKFRSKGRNLISGTMNADGQFYNNSEGQAVADVNILPSVVHVGDSIWHIDASNITYHKDFLAVKNFAVHHADQHILVNGTSRKNGDEGINIDLRDVNVSYILDLVNFHSVEFAGYCTGTAVARNIFGTPEAEADIRVDDFRFETGRLGTLHAKANWNLDEGNINIDAKAIDGKVGAMDITGFVSPKHSCIDLKVDAKNACLEFLENYCSSFASDINLRATGQVNVVGPFKAINILGNALASGTAHISALNTTYTLKSVPVTLVENNIIFENDTIADRNGNIGIVNGRLKHNHLSHFTFDIHIDANNLLAFDTHSFGDDTFYGTVYGTGSCDLIGRPGEVIINVEATPERGSQIVYNASSPDRQNGRFVHWVDRDSLLAAQNNPEVSAVATHKHDMSSDFRLNLLIHATPNATLKVLMDERSGDYIALNGNGGIRASYYNKGAFDMFGNYIVSSGTYRLTIQDVIKREFTFLPGGAISFGGDAYDAALNLQAMYTLNSVPLSDINIGRSFSNNNIRVDCLMNISGTPGHPHVDFSLDMPTVGTDAKQMVMSVMNSSEQINQQVIYLLAIGRFLNLENNSASDSQRQSQTSLAMQSILSGTLSQQLSAMLDNVIDNKQWNVGANISTGDEGFNNAEYEGLVSGRLFNNRLLIDGQFGYRDNPNATSSFIGDFDIRYLLVPTGSAAIRVYNQTNNKYFTKSTLTTQGVGLVLKKDFGSWREFLKWRKQEKVKNKK